MPLQRENMKILSRLMLANFINDLVLGGLIHFIFNSFGRSHLQLPHDVEPDEQPARLVSARIV